MTSNTSSIQTLKGFRDFLPAEKQGRSFVAAKISEAFELFGFSPIETPTLEYASLLLGKYGDEADQLVYRFTDRGDREVALRYDQTVPTARVLAQYQSALPKFFRRYQVQNVFRADKPQKGRYREFTQCDIDIFGTTSPIADAEILAGTYAAFTNIGFSNVELRVNDRQVLLATLKPFETDQVDVFSIIQSIDKLDKLTPDQVSDELIKKGVSPEAVKEILAEITTAKESDNLKTIMSAAKHLGVPESQLVFTPTLARGLDYYTGMIFEVIVPEYGVGSCGGGGRYDNLIENLSGVSIPAVGIGIGFDRVVEAAQALDLIPSFDSSAQALVVMFGPETQPQTLETAAKLRLAGIATELYPEFDKLGKQFKLADQKKIRFAVIVGEEEAAHNLVALKDMTTGSQEQLTFTEAVETIKAVTS